MKALWKKRLAFFMMVAMILTSLNVPVLAAEDTQDVKVADEISETGEYGIATMALPGNLKTVNINKTWSLDTLDGGKFTQNTYAGKTLLVMFDDCSYTYGTTLSLLYNIAANKNWVKAENIQVVVIDRENTTAENVARYKSKITANSDDIVFALNGQDVFYNWGAYVWGNANGIEDAICMVVQDGTIVRAWSGCSSADECEDVLKDVMGDNYPEFTDIEVGLGVEYHTQEEVQAFVDANPASLTQLITYKTEPSFSEPYSPGVLSDETVASALNMLNQVRYIAGVNANVTNNENKAALASSGMLLNYLNNDLNHYPARPSVLSNSKYDTLYKNGYTGASSSNICKGAAKLNSSIIGWLADEDSSNISTLGHRRWFLSPKLTQTGFGAAGNYQAAYVADGFWTGQKNMYVAWPAQEMPLDYFDSSYPWSISLGYVDSSITKENITVALTRLSDNYTWNFGGTSSQKDFYVDTGSYGTAAAVIFRPSSIRIKSGQTYEVAVRIGDGKGGSTTIKYQVRFFDLGAPEVSENLKITSQPSNVTVDTGSQATFTVKADGSGLKYQWYYKKSGSNSWTKWSGHTTASTSATSNNTWNKMQVRCVITDSKGNTVTSNAATITLKPVITTQPKSVTVNTGSQATFTVKADGSGLKYQWYYKKSGSSSWSVWNGHTTASTSATSNNTWNKMQVRCVVTDSNGYTVTSSAATITLKPVITTQPKSVTVASGSKTTFTVKADGSGLTYQWYYKKSGSSSWSKWNGHTTASTSATSNDTWNKMQVRCVVTDSNGYSVTSSAATITIKSLAITSQPSNVTVNTGSQATFTVKAEGSGLTYQWYYKKSGSSSWSVWNGHTTASTTATSNNTWNKMQVRCVVTDSNGNSVTSNAATVTLKPVITTQPKNVTVNTGSQATFTVKADGSGLTYQWYYKKSGSSSWSKWNGHTTASTSATSNDTWNKMQVRCVVTDSNGYTVTSSAATVTLK